MDKLELVAKLDTFCLALTDQTQDRLKRTLYAKAPEHAPRDEFGYDIGYKYARIYCDFGNQKIAKYFVDVRTGDIYDCKSWTQANTRRWYGTLDTIEEWTWAFKPATPLPGTPSEVALYEREATIKEGYQKRGRKPKT